MMKLKTTTGHPASCSPSKLEQFRALVLLGDEVISTGLMNRISCSFRLAWSLDEPRMIAVAALKRPNEGYHKSVFKKSEASEHYADWEAELLASIFSPRRINSLAFCMPTSLSKMGEIPPVTKIPKPTSGKKQRVFSAMMVKSQFSSHSNPPPAAQP